MLIISFQHCFSSQASPAAKGVRVLVIGLDNAGKTAIVYRLKYNAMITTIPTVGFNVEMVSWTLARGIYM